MTTKTKNLTTILWLAGVTILLGWLFLSSIGIFNNFMGFDARHAGVGWKIVEFALLLIAGILIYRYASGKAEASSGSIFGTLVLIALAFSSSTGFKFTAGDIKQTVTFVNLDGKITDMKGFTKYYGDFYHLDTDTALVNYINKYNELPGVNHWAFNICCALPASTRHPKSTAPRAEENYQWHTGSYEVGDKKLPK